MLTKYLKYLFRPEYCIQNLETTTESVLGIAGNTYGDFITLAKKQYMRKNLQRKYCKSCTNRNVSQNPDECDMLQGEKVPLQKTL